ncbi:MAG: glutathione S-transferase N-terminal domain-containing protein [Alphaproteobacteria bacterium]
MRLHFQRYSPYVRKVRVVALEHGLEGRIELVPTNTWNLPAALLDDNPLGKVPTLVTDDGLVLYDSPVIAEYLDALGAGARLFPSVGRARWLALRQQAMGDGIMDAAIERFLERMRPEERRMDDWSARYKAGIDRTLDVLERAAHELERPLTIGPIAIACALGYLDLRFAADGWRTGRPELARWLDRFALRPSMRVTGVADGG